MMIKGAFLSFSATAFIIGISIGTVQAQSSDNSGNVIPVNSPAFVFSPGNWTGDSGRGGSVFRQSWYPGAYFRVTWTTSNAKPAADLLAAIYLIVPFGQYGLKPLQDALTGYQAGAPEDKKVFLIDLGKPMANALAANGYWSGLHPNLRGHAVFASKIPSKITIP